MRDPVCGRCARETWIDVSEDQDADAVEGTPKRAPEGTSCVMCVRMTVMECVLPLCLTEVGDDGTT